MFDPPSPITDFDVAVASHDARLAELGLTIWVGSEPTFTDRAAQTPEWLNQALGGEKETRAGVLTASLHQHLPGSIVLHSVGRQYPGEDRPRWNMGLYRRRDGIPVYPVTLSEKGVGKAVLDLDVWATTLASELASPGWHADIVPCAKADERRLLLRITQDIAFPDMDDERLARPLVQAAATPASGLKDTLAEEGLYLFILYAAETGNGQMPCIELPMFDQVPDFLNVLGCLGQASTRLSALMFTGYPPPVDASVEWTTITPDPAVIEINTAPSIDARDFLARNRVIYTVATEQGLSPYRLYFNGTVADSGGGGQITLGGPSPEQSPFLQMPQVLPGLVRFFNRHPALSYLYCHDYIGGSGQSVRADERGTDAFDELRLALTLLARNPKRDPETLWHALASFLCDASGNSHRAELNIEKLWNPYLGSRGTQGLVEFRALRMQHSPERATALACLLRAIVAMLAKEHDTLPLMDWGRELHDRYALPFYLEQDLDAVLEALDSVGLGLGSPIETMLRRDEFRFLGHASLPGCVLELRRALEFWPLLGDAASPEQSGSSRLIDASTTRMELRLRPTLANEPDWEGWHASVAGMDLPMRRERDAQGALKVYGLRYRSFVPSWGLHPDLPTQTPLRIHLRHPQLEQSFLVTLHEWRPDGSAYPGLPETPKEAAARRAERITVETAPAPDDQPDANGPIPEPRDFFLDLRYLK